MLFEKLIRWIWDRDVVSIGSKSPDMRFRIRLVAELSYHRVLFSTGNKHEIKPCEMNNFVENFYLWGGNLLGFLENSTIKSLVSLLAKIICKMLNLKGVLNLSKLDN